MKLGCSYFGNRILKHVRTDMQELAQMGCTYVVHCFNENDWLFYHDTIREIVDISHGAGLEVHIDPWGVGKVFGGESFSNFVMQNVDAMQMVSDGKPVGSACPNHPRFRAFMREWIDAAVTTGADVLFWDEPHFYLAGWMGGRPNTWGCRCAVCAEKFQQHYGSPLPAEENDEVRKFKENSIIEFLGELVAYGHECGKRNSLCVLPLRDASHSTANWQKLAGIPHLDIFGTDPYWYAFNKDMREFVGAACEDVKEVCTQHNLDSQIWLQGYKTPAGREHELVEAVELMVQKGIRDIAVWGFQSCGFMSWIRPDNPEIAWAKVKEAFARAKGIGTAH
ncbi:MAG: hypothetical protein ACR2IE_03455 [Candidatus Sumerlaeaceae bacterium]